MKHLRPLTKSPQRASIDLNALINAKVESKENFINEKANVFI